MRRRRPLNKARMSLPAADEQYAPFCRISTFCCRAFVIAVYASKIQVSKALGGSNSRCVKDLAVQLSEL